MRTFPLCLILVTLLAGVGPVAALHQPSARTEERAAGPYRMLVRLSPDPARVMEPLRIVVAGQTLAGAMVTLIGQPALGNNAMPTRPVRLIEDASAPGQYAAMITFQIVGAWELDLRVEGAGGSGRTLVPIVVSISPSAVRQWQGWMIGLSPLLGLAWFGWWNWRRYTSRPAVSSSR